MKDPHVLDSTFEANIQRRLQELEEARKGFTSSTGLGGGGAEGPKGEAGAAGLSAGDTWKFSTTTTASDPGSGNLRFNNATLASVTKLYVSETDSYGAGVNTWISEWQGGTSNPKSILFIREIAHPENYLIVKVPLLSTLKDEGTWHSVEVEFLAGAGTISNLAPVSVQWVKMGDRGIAGATWYTDTKPPEAGLGEIGDFFINTAEGKALLLQKTAPLTWTSKGSIRGEKGETGAGEKGATGPTGPAGGGVPYKCSTSHAIENPGSEFLRFSGITFSGSTEISASKTSIGGAVGPYLETWDDSTTTAKGYILIEQVGLPTNFAIYQLTALGLNEAWVKFTVTHITSAGSMFPSGAELRLTFLRTGDKGAAGSNGEKGAEGKQGPADWTPTGLVNVTQLGPASFEKTGGVTGTWDAGFYAAEGFERGSFVSFIYQAGMTSCMIGLNSDPASSEGYASIDYAMYVAGGKLRSFESGVEGPELATLTAGDVCMITYDGENVRWYVNGVVKRTVARAIGLSLWLDSSFATAAAKVENLRYGPMGSVGPTGPSSAGAYRDVWHRDAAVPAATAIGSYLMPNAALVTTAALGAGVGGTKLIEPTSYAVSGKTTKFLITVALETNATAPAASFKVQLAKISAVKGAAGGITRTVTTIIKETGVITTPAKETMTANASAEFEITEAGFYAFILVTSGGATAASSFEGVSVDLLVKNV